MNRRLFSTIAISIASLKLYAAPVSISQCKTTETCTVGQTCTCQVMPSYAYNRYFYVDFSGLQAKNHYQCKMSGDNYTVDFNGSTFPQGATYQCSSQNCPRFPVAFSVDTTLMSEPQADMTIRYFVPASDTAFPITFSCKSD